MSLWFFYDFLLVTLYVFGDVDFFPCIFAEILKGDSDGSDHSSSRYNLVFRP